jgi:mannose-1-phosphate guanylyltransferase
MIKYLKTKFIFKKIKMCSIFLPIIEWMDLGSWESMLMENCSGRETNKKRVLIEYRSPKDITFHYLAYVAKWSPTTF